MVEDGFGEVEGEGGERISEGFGSGVGIRIG